MPAEEAADLAVHSKMVVVREDADWIEVDSAFGGLAIYRRQALVGARYNGLDGQGAEICEHATLHAKLRTNGHRIFINPKFINTDVTAHTKHFTFRNRIKYRRKLFLRWGIAKVIGIDRLGKFMKTLRGLMR